jgi:N-acetylglucosamine-6-sulfatase
LILISKPALLRQIDELPPLGAKTATSDEEVRGRLEMLLAVDDSIGRILAALERKGVLNDTVVIFTSDHGYFYGEHGLNEERRLAYEENHSHPDDAGLRKRTSYGTDLGRMRVSVLIASLY